MPDPDRATGQAITGRNPSCSAGDQQKTSDPGTELRLEQRGFSFGFKKLCRLARIWYIICRTISRKRGQAAFRPAERDRSRTAKRDMKGLLLFILVFLLSVPSAHGETYRYVDEKGTVHFVDDLTKIPEKYRPEAELRKGPKEVPGEPVRAPGKGVAAPASESKPREPEGFEVQLLRRHELWMTEVVLNDKLSQHLILDTGASFSLISPQAANALGIAIDENTPLIPGTTVSGTVLLPLVTLRFMRVGKAELENVEAVVHSMPSGNQGLLGNSFLNKFRVILDAVSGKMTLFPMQGVASPDRPGGYGKDYWVGQFRFYQRNLEELKGLLARYQSRSEGVEFRRIRHAIRYFENHLSELERRASFAGVPRSWRD